MRRHSLPHPPDFGIAGPTAVSHLGYVPGLAAAKLYEAFVRQRSAENRSSLCDRGAHRAHPPTRLVWRTIWFEVRGP
jgi:hypothetical protein